MYNFIYIALVAVQAGFRTRHISILADLLSALRIRMGCEGTF